MRPEFACNLLEALPLPPWTKDVAGDLHVTRKWEKRIPFPCYVQPTPPSTTATRRGQATSFTQFSTLAAELQLRILSVCSPSTLFQLMHVSPTLRAEASKLFWANPHAYFLVDAYWLLDGGYAGYQCCSLGFLQNVQNVEIEYEPSVNNDIWPQYNGNMAIRQDRITTFWESIKQRFPQLKRVIINQNGEPGIWKGVNAVPPPLQAIVQACPCTVEICVLVVERRSPPSTEPSTRVKPLPAWQQSTYQFRAGDVWTKLEPRHRETILLPTRRFKGLVGRYEVLKHRCQRIQLQQYGLWPLAIEALDRHYFDNGRNKPFTCPLPECNAYFGEAGVWTVHAAVSHYQHREQFDILPAELRAEWEERAGLLEKSITQARTQFSILQQEWDTAGADRRAAIKRIWEQQLEENGMWGVGNEEVQGGKIWRDFIEWACGSGY
jgi:hypothetical protein